MATATQYQVNQCLPNAQSWELPFRHRVTLIEGQRGRYLTICSWQPYRTSIQGIAGSGYQLLPGGHARITKRGDLGRLSSELSNGGNASDAVFAAHRAWLAAGKPSDFEWAQ